MSARADEMDPAIERLVTPFNYTLNGTPMTTSCVKNGVFPGNITPGIVSQCSPDNVAFAKLISQYGMAVAPTAMHSARTTGYGNFHLSLEAAYTTIDHGADYWHNGTQGTQDPNTKQFSTSNTNPASMLQVYSLRIRKGFPFGFEVGAQVGYMAQTTMVTGGADIRWSLLEGFRKGALGILPDVAVGGGVRTVTGTPEFNLTVASFDVQISKSLPIADSSILAPYVGYQMLWIFGDSGLVDTTPNTDPLGYCAYSGMNVPGAPGAPGGSSNSMTAAKGYNGQPICGSDRGTVGTNQDFNNTLVFHNVRVSRQRLILGMDYRYEIVFLGGQLMTEVVAPEDAGGRDNKELAGMPKQTSFAFHAGALF